MPKYMEILNCEFLDPLTWEYLPPEDKLDIWNYSKIECETQIVEEITDGTSTFYLTKDISYADFFIIFFLIVFTLFFIFDFIFKFIYKIKVNFRH